MSEVPLCAVRTLQRGVPRSKERRGQVRVWTRTEEHVYIEEERQKELDLLLDAPENTAGPLHNHG